jgi:hypothetical protein
MPAVPSRHNPFEFGGELKASALIDCEQELDPVIRTRERRQVTPHRTAPLRQDFNPGRRRGKTG